MFSWSRAASRFGEEDNGEVVSGVREGEALLLRFRVSLTSKRVLLSLGEGTFDILAAGGTSRLCADKGIDVLLTALRLE